MKIPTHKADIARLLLSFSGLGTFAASIANQQGIKDAVGQTGLNVLLIVAAAGTFSATLVNTLFSPASSSVPTPPNPLPPQDMTPSPNPPLRIVS